MIERLLLLFIAFTSCTDTRVAQSTIGQTSNTDSNRDSLYAVYKIDSINSYYLIYAKRQDALYKIVSKKEHITNCWNIQVNVVCPLSLSSIWKKDILIDGVNVSPSANPHVTCLSFDDSTKICLEKDSINDLYQASNLKGLCVIPQ